MINNEKDKQNTVDETVVSGMVIPKRLQIETFYGCNARCTMCAISKPATRPIGMMSMEMFRSIVDSLEQYKDYIEKIDLFALGEPLLDACLFERIEYLKSKGFRGLAISTNAHLLRENKQRQLLDSGIETVIFSIDGIKKETHEAIRRRISFDLVVENVQNTIKMRDHGKFQTRFILRFIRQSVNIAEWQGFQQFWQPKLSSKKGDLLILYDVNTMGGETYSKNELVGENEINDAIERMPCHQVFDRLIILADGSIPLCCEDTPRATINLGNITRSNPLDIWNGARMKHIRALHSAENKNKLSICAECTMLYSESNTQVIQP